MHHLLMQCILLRVYQSAFIDEKSFDLNHFGLKILFATDSGNAQSRFDKFMKMLNWIIKFSKIKQKLKSVDFEYGNVYELYHPLWQI